MALRNVARVHSARRSGDTLGFPFHLLHFGFTISRPSAKAACRSKKRFRAAIKRCSFFFFPPEVSFDTLLKLLYDYSEESVIFCARWLRVICPCNAEKWIVEGSSIGILAEEKSQRHQKLESHSFHHPFSLSIFSWHFLGFFSADKCNDLLLQIEKWHPSHNFTMFF